MNAAEYNIRLQKLNIKHESDKRELAKTYAYTNNPYKIDDIISDHMGAIIIREWKVYLSAFSLPALVYYGTELNKDGNPAKKQSGRGVHQSNIVTTKSAIK